MRSYEPFLNVWVMWLSALAGRGILFVRFQELDLKLSDQLRASYANGYKKGVEIQFIWGVQ